MSAAKAVLEARAAGIRLCVEGDNLVLEAFAAPPPAVLDLLSRHKAAVVSWLRPGADGWSGEDWQAHFDERAGIAEFDGGLSRPEAEALALAEIMASAPRPNLPDDFGKTEAHDGVPAGSCVLRQSAATRTET